MGNVQLILKHKYKCCLMETGDAEESDDDNTRQLVEQIPVMETGKTESFMTTVPCNFRK